MDNFRQAFKSSKSGNSMGYICLKTTFLELKHFMQKIYVTLLSTTCVKIHQIPYAIFETISFHDTSRLYPFSSIVTYFWQKYPIKVQIFRLFTVQVKIHQISHGIFQTKVSFSLHFGWLFSVWWEITLLYFFSWNCTWFGKKSPSKCKISDFWLLM